MPCSTNRAVGDRDSFEGFLSVPNLMGDFTMKFVESTFRTDQLMTSSIGSLQFFGFLTYPFVLFASNLFDLNQII